MDVIATAQGLYSPQSSRGLLNQGADWIAKALRAGDTASAAHTLGTHATGLGLDDAVLGTRELYRVPWSTDFARAPRDSVAILHGPRQTLFLDQLQGELRLHGVDPQLIDASKIEAIHGGRMLVDGVEQAIPEAAFSGTSILPYAQALDVLEAQGTFVVNRSGAVLAGRDKNVMAHVFTQAGISVPRSRPDLRTVPALLQAAEELQYPVVMKIARSAGSRGVELARTPEELLATAERWGLRPGVRMPPERGLLLQESLDLGRRDARVHYSTDPVVGEILPVSGTDRVALGSDFRANGGTEGNMIRPIFDLSGNDPALGADMIEEGRRAGKAAGLDVFSVDVARRMDTGKPVVIEVDNFAHPSDNNHPVPREQQTWKHTGELLAYGDRAAWAAAR